MREWLVSTVVWIKIEHDLVILCWSYTGFVRILLECQFGKGKNVSLEHYFAISQLSHGCRCNLVRECQARSSRLSWLYQSVTSRVRSDDHNMSSHCSRVFLLLIERSVCWVQSDDCANSLYIGEHTSFLFRSCICLLLQNTSLRGSVDTGLVHHVAVRVFSCTLSEECYLNYNVMTNMSTCMSLALTRLCGECWLVLLRYYFV